ncbi:hypothetical protein [Methylobacterium gregans]|uniref:hypothetical protein n=1 Tax=Methylobacterium gregans TaxID=374424 RepID=UPI00360FC4A2
MNDFDSALAFADTLLTGRTYAYVTSGTAGADGYLFVDETGDGRADAALILQGSGGTTPTLRPADIV